MITEPTSTIISFSRNFHVVFNSLAKLSPFSGLKISFYKKNYPSTGIFLLLINTFSINTRWNFVWYIIGLSPRIPVPIQVKKTQKPQEKLVWLFFKHWWKQFLIFLWMLVLMELSISEVFSFNLLKYLFGNYCLPGLDVLGNGSWEVSLVWRTSTDSAKWSSSLNWLKSENQNYPWTTKS